MIITLAPRSVFLFLMSSIVVLLGMDALLLFIKFGLGHDSVYGITYLFDLDTEQNIPTLFSTLDLVLAAGLLWAHYRESRASLRTDAIYWLGLSIIFVLLAVDEFASLHERLTKPVQQLLNTSGALSYAWVIPYSVLVLAFAALYFRFWWRLPTRSRIVVFLSAACYVGGALGMELVGAKLDSLYGLGSALIGVEAIVEEGLEMSGIALFVYALLESLRDRGIMMRFEPDRHQMQNAELLDDALSRTPRKVVRR
jgi:hypothetical protein